MTKIISGHQGPSRAIRDNQGQSRTRTCSADDEDHQWPSRAIKGHKGQSGAIEDTHLLVLGHGLDALERARTPLSLDGLGAILHGEPGEGR